jgi:hypothetical protein
VNAITRSQGLSIGDILRQHRKLPPNQSELPIGRLPQPMAIRSEHGQRIGHAFGGPEHVRPAVKTPDARDGAHAGPIERSMTIVDLAACRSICVVLVVGNSYPNTICLVPFSDGADDYTKARQVMQEMLLHAAGILIHVLLIHVLLMPTAISRLLGWLMMQTNRDVYFCPVSGHRAPI